MADNKPSNRERIKEIVTGIEAGIQDLFQSDKFADYLRTMSRFHNYSYNNTILIHMQMPSATHVAGFLSYFSDKNPYPCFIVIFLNRCFFYKSGHYRMVCSDNFWLRYNSMYGLC